MSIRETFKELKQLEIALVKYCHSNNCRYYFHCPKNHPKCNEKLDLHTAIAWALSTNIQYVMVQDRYIKFWCDNRLVSCIRKVKRFIIEIEHNETILSYHNSQYQNLIPLLSRARIHLMTYASFLENEMKKRSSLKEKLAHDQETDD
jgi:hypothetical protein